MVDELKPCPFCGGKAQIVIMVFDENIYTVQCQSCFAMMGREHKTRTFLRGRLFYSTKQEAVDAWNRRYKEGQQHETD